MSHNYVGTPTFAPSVACPDDGDPRNASSINVPLEALRNADVYLKAQTDRLILESDFLAANFPVCNPSVGSTNVAAVYDPFFRGVIALGNANVRTSYDWGCSFPVSSEIAGVYAGSDYVCRGAVDGLGNAILATRDRYAYVRTGAGSWARIDVQGATQTSGPLECAVAYSTTLGIWVHMMPTGAGGTSIRTSLNRTTWTSRTASSNFANLFAWTRLGCNQAQSTFLAAAVFSTGEVRFSRSTSGTSWTDLTALITGVASPTHLELVHNPEADPAGTGAGTWMLMVGSSATPRTRIYTSTDNGSTWTSKANLTTRWFGSVAGIGPIWIASANMPSNSTFPVVRSIDGGQTWTPTGFDTNSSSHVQRGAGGFILTGDKVYTSLRRQDPGQAPLT